MIEIWTACKDQPGWTALIAVVLIWFGWLLRKLTAKNDAIDRKKDRLSHWR